MGCQFCSLRWRTLGAKVGEKCWPWSFLIAWQSKPKWNEMTCLDNAVHVPLRRTFFSGCSECSVGSKLKASRMAMPAWPLAPACWEKSLGRWERNVATSQLHLGFVIVWTMTDGLGIRCWCWDSVLKSETGVGPPPVGSRKRFSEFKPGQSVEKLTFA